MKSHLKCLLFVLIVVMACSNIAMAKTTLTLLGNFSKWPDSFDQAIANFSAANNVTVEVLHAAPWDRVREKAATLAATGLAADVIYGDNRTLWYGLLNGITEPLNVLAARDINLSRYPGEVLVPLSYKGQLYALPTALSLFNMAYSPEMFAKAGVKEPPTDWESKSFTWDEFVNTARKFTQDTDGDGAVDQWGTQTFGAAGGHNHIGLWGVYFVGDASPEYYGDRPEVISAYEKTSSLWTKFGVVGGNFIKGTAAMNAFQSYNLNALIATDAMFSWGVAVMPKGTQRASQTAFMGLSLGKGSKNKEMAWRLIKYLAYDTEGAVLFTRAENRVPVLRETALDFIRRYSVMMPEKNVRAITDAIGYVYDQRFSRFLRADEIAAQVVAAGQSIVKGTVSVTQALTSIGPTVRSLLAEK